MEKEKELREIRELERLEREIQQNLRQGVSL
jgi:hypothetical protein